MDVNVRVFSTRFLRVSDIESWLLLVVMLLVVMPSYKNDVGL